MTSDSTASVRQRTYASPFPAYVALVIVLPVPPRPVLPDIAFPLRTRLQDEPGAGPLDPAAIPTIDRRAVVAAPRNAALPFMAERLLSAPGRFGLEVEIKSEQRVVGTWTIEVDPPGAGGSGISRAKADLYVCASACGDARANGAFLVIRRWWVRVCDAAQVERLYEALSAATLDRLDALLAGAPDETDESRSCVLFLIDERGLDKRTFSADRLQIRILEDLERDHAIAGMDMRVAHGRGKAIRPHVPFESTLPAPAQTADAGPGDNGTVRRSAPSSLLSQAFVRETLSPENLRWKRRASDRVLARELEPRMRSS